MKPKVQLKRYIVRKYIMAKSAKEAMKKERQHMPDDIWVDEEWKKENPQQLVSAVGFQVITERDYE